MKRITSTAIACAFLALSSSNLAMADKDKDDDKDHQGGGGQKVTMCHRGVNIVVKQKEVQEHLAHGDILGSCSVGLPF